MLIDLYFLYQMTREREHFSLAEVRATSDYLHQFLRFYRAEIERFQPGFTHQPDRPQTVLFVLRDMVPAGLVITEPRDAESLWIALDFVTPAYRDFRVAEFVFRQNAERFRARGVHALYSAAGSPVHAAYLRRLGFAPVADGFRLTLAA